MEKSIRSPAYREVYEKLKTDISNGIYPAGSLLPPEPQLEKMFYVSRTTVRKAIELLSADRLIQVRQGHGTEVLDQKISQNLNTITSISQTLAKKGYQVGTKSMFIQIIPASAFICEALNLPKSSPVAEINRIKTADGLPVAISKNYIPYELVKGIENEQKKIVSLYQYLEQNYQIHMDASRDTISACGADFSDSELLQIKPCSALLTMQRICYCNHVPVELDLCKISAEKYAFEINTYF